jgi:hypothetical protein
LGLWWRYNWGMELSKEDAEFLDGMCCNPDGINSRLARIIKQIVGELGGRADTNTTPAEKLTNFKHAAARLGIPAAWLKTEVIAGRIPSILISRSLMVRMSDVGSALTAKAHARTVG